jgi:hypothetical protein
MLRNGSTEIRAAAALARLKENYGKMLEVLDGGRVRPVSMPVDAGDTEEPRLPRNGSCCVINRPRLILYISRSSASLTVELFIYIAHDVIHRLAKSS